MGIGIYVIMGMGIELWVFKSTITFLLKKRPEINPNKVKNVGGKVETLPKWFFQWFWQVPSPFNGTLTI